MQPVTKNLSDLPSRQRSSCNPQISSLPVVSMVFFSLFYLFLWLVIEPELVYHYFEISQQTPFFKTGGLFLRDCFSYPGGPSQYLAAFLTQLCFSSWLGAFCITLVAWAICRLTISLTAIKADDLWRVICYLPALLILMACGRYENPLSTAMAVLFAVFFSVLYEKLSPSLGPWRAILFLIICGAVYYIAGSAALVFIALAVLYEFYNRGEPVFCVLFLFLGLAVCWVLGVYVFELEIGEAYLYSSPFIQVRQNEQREHWARVFEGALFVIVPVIFMLVASARKLVKSVSTFSPPRSRKEKASAAESDLYQFYRGKLRWVTQLVLLILISMLGTFISFDLKVKRVVQVSYFTCRKMWPDVLAIARKGPLKRYFPFCAHSVNRALYYTDRLGDQMFTWPQDPRAADMLFSAARGANNIFMERAQMCLEVGLVNVAEKIAHEFLEGADDNPFILKQFALINIVKRQTETARVFLGALSKNLMYSKEAKHLLRILEADPTLELDEEIQKLRSIMITDDEVYNDYNEEEWLEELLRRNKYNKMAFEYLMAHYLLTRQLDKFIENLPRLDDFHYENIPRHYQEAILLYIGTTRKDVDLRDRGINVDTVEQYNEINEIGEKFGYDGNTIFQLLAPRFGRTYFFYFTFGVSGVTQ